MIEEKFAKDQIRRMSGLDGFPKDTKAIHELVLALMVCTRDSQAIGVVSDILAEAQRSPAPSTVRTMAYQKQEQDEAERLSKLKPVHRNAYCPDCKDFGYYGGHLLGGEREPEPWRWCDCATGREERFRNPNLVDEANRAYSRIVTLFPTVKSLNEIVGAMAAKRDTYHGEF